MTKQNQPKPKQNDLQQKKSTSQRGQTINQQGSQKVDDDDVSPEMNQAGEQSKRSSEGLRQGALDKQHDSERIATR